jgi:hypothetical protein
MCRVHDSGRQCDSDDDEPCGHALNWRDRVPVSSFWLYCLRRLLTLPLPAMWRIATGASTPQLRRSVRGGQMPQQTFEDI